METKLPVTDKTFVEKIIPQKKPFVMVDSLLEYSEQRLKSGFTVPAEHLFLENGNFQAAGVVEHQAQSVALHTGYQFWLKNEEPPVGYIGAVKKFEISRLPKTGEKLETEVQILEELMGVTLVKATTNINGEEIARSEMKTVLK